MNRLVSRWHKARARAAAVAGGPDGLVIEGGAKVVAQDMAERKAPQLDPVLDNSAGSDEAPVVHSLTPGAFASFVRLLYRAPRERVLQVRTQTYSALKRVGAKRDVDSAVSSLPKRGSDQGDVGTLVGWIQSVPVDDTKAVEQLVTLDATCCKLT